jgi:integrase/recombinase XerC
MEMVVSNPLAKIDSLKIKKRLPVFVSETKMGQLLDDVLCGTEFTDLRSMLMLDMFYLTGIRLSELINIKETDIDFSGSTIKVLGKRNKERIIPVTKELLLNCNKYLQVRNQEVPKKCEFLFVTHKGEKLYPKLVYRTVKSALTSVTTMEKRSPHVLRHTFATHMLNNGAGINAIKELLGHENLAATQIYTHNSFEKLKKIYKQAHPRA